MYIYRVWLDLLRDGLKPLIVKRHLHCPNSVTIWSTFHTLQIVLLGLYRAVKQPSPVNMMRGEEVQTLGAITEPQRQIASSSAEPTQNMFWFRKINSHTSTPS